MGIGRAPTGDRPVALDSDGTGEGRRPEFPSRNRERPIAENSARASWITEGDST